MTTTVGKSESGDGSNGPVGADHGTSDAAVGVDAGPTRSAKAELPVVTNSAVDCHGGKDQLRRAAAAAGNDEMLAQFSEDYPTGPHDQPQSMCPAFGSLRVGLRMRRTATILSGSACCVYGLTFTSHFYGARRSVGYVPFNSETLVTGKLYEDIHESVYEMADPEKYDAVVVTNLCVPSASGVPLRLLPDEIKGVRIIGIDVPGFGIPTHAEAKDVLAGAMLKYARNEIMEGPVAAPRDAGEEGPTVSLLGEMFPADPVAISMLIKPMGMSLGTTVPTREWRELYTALDSTVIGAVHPFYTSAIREFEAAGKPVIGSAPVGLSGTEAWLDQLGQTVGISKADVDKAKGAALPAIQQSLADASIRGSINVSGYEGSELLVARLLIECGAEVAYVGTACPRTVWSDADREWLEAQGVEVRFRASLEQDLDALERIRPDLAIGTTPVVQRAKELAIPGLYFTNLISARPLMGAMGGPSLAATVNAAMANKKRFESMREFFEGVGTDYATGVWEEKPEDRPQFRASYRRKMEKIAKSMEAVGN